MVILKRWIAEEGFRMNTSRIALCRRIFTPTDGLKWALLRRFDGLPDAIYVQWEVLKYYAARKHAQQALSDIEKGMQKNGFETSPMRVEDIPKHPYAHLTGYGAF